MSTERQEDIITEHLTTLFKSFDAIQIFITNIEAGNTHSLVYGIGNYFARYGHAKRWCETQRSEDRNPVDPELYEIIKNHVIQLSEFFDNIQILANKYDSTVEATYYCQEGTGDTFARYGVIKSWLLDEEKG